MVTFVPTPIGNIEDITFRALKVLENAQILFCEDSRVAKKLLLLLSQKFDTNFNIEKFIPLHSHNEKKVLSNIDKEIFEKNVVYMSDAGMPSISDPGSALVLYCQENDIEYDVLPGANAVLLSFVNSGFGDKEFLFLGFLPHKGKDRERELDKALYSGYTTVLYESPHRIEKLINEITLIEPTRELFAIKEATKLYQTKFHYTAKELNEKFKSSNLRGEWCVVIKAGEKSDSSMALNDIKNLNIPKRDKAKLLSKATGQSVKECYNELLQNE